MVERFVSAVSSIIKSEYIYNFKNCFIVGACLDKVYAMSACHLKTLQYNHKKNTSKKETHSSPNTFSQLCIKRSSLLLRRLLSNIHFMLTSNPLNVISSAE